MVQTLGSLKSKNPTWTKKSSSKKTYRKSTIIEKLIDNYENMVYDISVSNIANKKSSTSVTINSDFLKTNFFENSIDCVITSPPYLTRIDYAVSTKPENLLLLGDSDQFNNLRMSTLL